MKRPQISDKKLDKDQPQVRQGPTAKKSEKFSLDLKKLLNEKDRICLSNKKQHEKPTGYKTSKASFKSVSFQFQPDESERQNRKSTKPKVQESMPDSSYLSDTPKAPKDVDSSSSLS